MNRLLFGVFLAASMGCTSVQPIGPLAKPTRATKGPPVVNEQPEPAPLTVAAPRPVPPAELIMPSQVMAENPQIAVQKLTAEIATDRQSLEALPRTAEVSVYKNGEKIR